MGTFVLMRGVYYLREQPFSPVELIRKLWKRERKPYLNNTPRFIKVYDNGGATIDRYTIIFTEKKVNGREYLVLKLSDEADEQFHNMHTMLVDSPSKKSVMLAGKEIRFRELPVHCQEVVLEYYGDLWNVN